MRRAKHAPVSRVLAALVGALAILALVAGPGLAHPGFTSGSRVYEPKLTWSTSQTRFGFTANPDSAGSDQVDKDALESETEDTNAEADDQGEQSADENDDDQGADENDSDQGEDQDSGEHDSTGDHQSAGDHHDGDSGGDGEDSGDHGGDQEGGD